MKRKGRAAFLAASFLVLFSGLCFLTGPSRAAQQQTGYWTIAVFGLDSRDGNLGEGAAADAQLLCSINRDTGEVRLASVYRDMLCSKRGKFDKISTSYMKGGPLQNLAVLNDNLDLETENYMSFSWSAAAEAVDALGGVDLELTTAEYIFINAFITETVNSVERPSKHLSGPGPAHLDGVQTVAYLRLRLMDSDMQRTARLRTVLGLLLEKAKQADAQTLLQAAKALLPEVSTNLSMEDLWWLIQRMNQLHITGSEGFPFDYTTAPVGKRGGICVIPGPMEEQVAKLHEFLYGEEGYQCSEQVRKIEKELRKYR